ncbi:MAG: hypothetical protein Q8L92_10755, partial [Rubrivivax sp.]|nr:hypothetical protein [Rubrivivax sp.]
MSRTSITLVFIVSPWLIACRSMHTGAITGPANAPSVVPRHLVLDELFRLVFGAFGFCHLAC